MTQLQILSILAPIWAAVLVGGVVWFTNKADDRAMRRELLQKSAALLEVSKKASPLAVEDIFKNVMADQESRITSIVGTSASWPYQLSEHPLAASRKDYTIAWSSNLTDQSSEVIRLTNEIHKNLERMAALAKPNVRSPET